MLTITTYKLKITILMDLEIRNETALKTYICISGRKILMYELCLVNLGKQPFAILQTVQIVVK